MTVESARHESFLLSRVVFRRPVVRERVAYAARAGVRPRLGRRPGGGRRRATARAAAPLGAYRYAPRAFNRTGARSHAAGAGPTCAGLSVSRLERLVIVRLLNYCRDNAYIVKLVVTFQLA